MPELKVHTCDCFLVYVVTYALSFSTRQDYNSGLAGVKQHQRLRGPS